MTWQDVCPGCKRLLRDGYDVRVVDRRTNDERAVVLSIFRKLETIEVKFFDNPRSATEYAEAALVRLTEVR